MEAAVGKRVVVEAKVGKPAAIKAAETQAVLEVEAVLVLVAEAECAFFSSPYNVRLLSSRWRVPDA